jgi:hypothetical protein
VADVDELIDVFDPRERLVGASPRGPLQLPPIGHHGYATQEDVVYRETDVPHIIDPRVVPGLVSWLDARF